MEEIDVFKGILNNYVFVAVLSCTVIFQIIIIEFLGTFANTTPLTFAQWFLSVFIGFLGMPIAAGLKMVPVGGGGHSEGFGNEPTGSGDREDGRRPLDMAELLRTLNIEAINSLKSLDNNWLSAQASILRVVSWDFNLWALVCVSSSLQLRGTHPRLASILVWMGTVATFLGFIAMIAMVILWLQDIRKVCISS